MAVFIRTYAWVASCHQPPNSRDRSVDLSSSSLVYTATSPFPEPFRYTAVPVPRPKAVPGRSPFCRGQRQPSSVSHRREFARRQRFCRAGKLQLEFLRKRKRDFFHTLLTQTPKRPNLFPYNALIPIPQNSLNATFPNCPFPVPKLFWVSSQISSDLLYRSYGECVSGECSSLRDFLLSLPVMWLFFPGGFPLGCSLIRDSFYLG